MPAMNPNSLRRTLVHPLARLLPLKGEQLAVYRMGEKDPPGLRGYAPRWEVISAVLGARQTAQIRVDIQRGWNVMALLGSATSNVAGGFRVQFYDVVKKRRMADRLWQFPNVGGNSGQTFFLREPYPFDDPRPQLLITLQNLEAVQNTVQLVLYGVKPPFQGNLR
jgi:hypothetical protein